MKLSLCSVSSNPRSVLIREELDQGIFCKKLNNILSDDTTEVTPSEMKKLLQEYNGEDDKKGYSEKENIIKARLKKLFF